MSQYRVHVEEQHDLLETHVYVYQNAGGGAQFVMQSEGPPKVLQHGVAYDGEPTLRIPWEYKDELLEALMPQRKDVDDTVLDTLSREQRRVDQFIEFMVGRDPHEYYMPLPERGPDAT